MKKKLKKIFFICFFCIFAAQSHFINTIHTLEIGLNRNCEGALHIKKVFAKATFLVILNVGNSITQNKNIAAVDTAGRYKTVPIGVR